MPIIKFAEKIGMHCNVYVDDVICVEKMTKWAELYKKYSIKGTHEGGRKT